MLKTRIIPCLDVDNGRVVKGVNFVDLIDAGDPVEQAKLYCDQGADELCFLDITATHEGRDTILDIVRRTADQVFMPLTVGGGVRSVEDIRNLLEAGADKVAINSAAIKNPEFVKEAAEKCGSQCIVVAIDAKHVSGDAEKNDLHNESIEGNVAPPLEEGNKMGRNEASAPSALSYENKIQPSKWEIFTHGGRKPTGLDAVEWAVRMADYGAGEILLTSMDRDGTKIGFDLELTRTISEAVPIPVIASGGVGNLDHLVEGVKEGKASAVLAASIFHFGTHTIQEAKQALDNAGVPVRL